MMKPLSVCAFILFIMSGIATGQAKVQPLEELPAPYMAVQDLSYPDLLSPDSLQASNLRNPIYNMPVYNPEDAGAKMLFWWPKKEYRYGMPNLLGGTMQTLTKPKQFKDNQKKKR